MQLLLQALAIGTVALVLYAYLLYPFVLAAIVAICAPAKRVPPPAGAARADKGDWPNVAVVLSAYNERVHIRSRVENLLSADYPADRLKVYIGSDGSTDGTDALLREMRDPRVIVKLFERNRGKAPVLNDLLDAVTESIVIFTDANTVFAPDAIRELLRPFTETRVGAVVGELQLADSAGSNQDSAYWRLEQRLKLMESQIGALLGANGGIYAIRRDCWRPLPRDTICDDFCVAMQIAANGARLIYQPSARADEDTPAEIADEYHRRLRIGIGNYQALFRNPQFLTRTSPATGFAYLSHKVLRWLAPHLLIVGWVASGLLCAQGIWCGFFAVQTLAYLLAAGVYGLTLRGVGIPVILRIPAFLFALNFAFLVASFRYLTGNYAGSWRRTARTGPV